jgi:2-haloacid dehalogenase
MLDFSCFKVLTFDCYGTLIDWETGILNAVRSVITGRGIEVDDLKILSRYAELEAKHEEGNYLTYTMVLRLVMTEMSLRFGFDATPAELDCLSRSLKDWEPFPDTAAALRRLAGRYKLAVVSNVDDRLFAETARRLGVAFDWVVTAEQARAYKPSHAVFERAFEKIGYPRGEILHVAQSIYHDVIPAKALGLATVWVNRRAGKPGSGATLPASAKADVEVVDLESLAGLAGV